MKLANLVYSSCFTSLVSKSSNNLKSLKPTIAFFKRFGVSPIGNPLRINYLKDNNNRCTGESPGEEQAKPLTNFQKLINDQKHIYASFPSDWDEKTELHTFWRKQGIREEIHRRALVDANLQDLRDGMPLPILIRLMKLRILRLKKLLPGISITEMLWKEPSLLTHDLVDMAQSLVCLRDALPGLNIPVVVFQEPSLLMQGDVGVFISGAIDKLQNLFPGADILRMINQYPGIVFQDVEAGLNRLRELKQGETIIQMAESNPMLLVKWSSRNK